MADWSEQAEQMLKTLTEAQKEVWGSWQDLAGRTMGASRQPQGFTMNPMEWFQQSMSTWADPAGVARDAGRQVFSSQTVMMQNLEMLTKAWQLVAPKLDAGQDWHAALTDFGSDWFQRLSGAPGTLFDLTKDTQSLWQSYLADWGPLLKPWISSMIAATGSGHVGEMLLGGSAGLNRLFMMEQDEYAATPFASLADIPSIGVAREHQAKILRAFDAFVDMRKVALQFNRMTLDALNKSVEAVMETLVEKGAKGEKIQSVRDLNRLWLDTADAVFTKMYASPEYLTIQRELSTKGMTYKIRQQEVIEMVLKGLNLPTRSELDDAYKTLYELRKEVKTLKKALREKTNPPAESGRPTPNAIKQVTATPVTAKKTPVHE